jgi:hypothetical protein
MNNEINELTEKVHALNARMIRLERSNKRIMFIASFLGCALFLVLSLGAISAQSPVQDVVITKDLQIVDNEGNLRAQIKNAYGSPGRPILVFYDEQRSLQATLGVGNGKDMFLQMYDEEHRLRLGLGIYDQGYAGLYLKGRDDGPSQVGIGMVVTPEGETSMVLRDKNGDLLFKVGS